MTVIQRLAVHARMVVLLSRAWQMHHELDDIEDLLETLDIPYPFHFFDRCRALLDDWIFWCTNLVCNLHDAILNHVRHLD